MTSLRVVQGTRVLAEIRIETVAEGTTVELTSEPPADHPPAVPPAPPRSRNWPATLAWTVFGIAGILAGKVLEASFWSPWNHARWVALSSVAIACLLVLHLFAGILFLALKVIGRRLRFTDSLRALALLSWLFPAIGVASLAAYYPLTPSAHNWFVGLLGAVAASYAVAVLAGLRREPRSWRFTAGWTALSLLAILGLASVMALGSIERGEPLIDLDLQAPIAGYAGRAESLDEYLAAIRTKAAPLTNTRPAASAPRARRGGDGDRFAEAP
jgi:hypothetical protein